MLIGGSCKNQDKAGKRIDISRKVFLISSGNLIYLTIKRKGEKNESKEKFD